MDIGVLPTSEEVGSNIMLPTTSQECDEAYNCDTAEEGHEKEEKTRERVQHPASKEDDILEKLLEVDTKRLEVEKQRLQVETERLEMEKKKLALLQVVTERLLCKLNSSDGDILFPWLQSNFL